MTRFYVLYMLIAVSAGLAWIQLVRETYRAISQRSFLRKPGRKPITPEDEPATYWLLVGGFLLGIIGLGSGEVVVILRLLHSS